MQKQSHRRLVWLILIPPILAVCLCMAFSIPYIKNFYNSSAYPDYLWSLRITKALSDEGYSVHDVTIWRSKSSDLKVVDVQIGNLLNDEEQRTYELVKEVHSVIIETFFNESAQPDPLTAIDVMVIDYDSGSYLVAIDYEIAQKFCRGEISEQTYFEDWSYPENTPEITPP